MEALRVTCCLPRMYRYHTPHDAILSTRDNRLSQRIFMRLASTSRSAAQHQLRCVQYDFVHPIRIRRHASLHLHQAHFHGHRAPGHPPSSQPLGYTVHTTSLRQHDISVSSKRYASRKHHALGDESHGPRHELARPRRRLRRLHSR